MVIKCPVVVVRDSRVGAQVKDYVEPPCWEITQRLFPGNFDGPGSGESLWVRRHGERLSEPQVVGAGKESGLLNCGTPNPESLLALVTGESMWKLVV